MVQCWDNGIQYIQNNSFEGTVSATNGTRVGGVIGYIKGIDKYNIIENNEYTCKDVKGIGAIDFVDTNYANPTPVEGVTYYNSEVFPVQRKHSITVPMILSVQMQISLPNW